VEAAVTRAFPVDPADLVADTADQVRVTVVLLPDTAVVVLPVQAVDELLAELLRQRAERPSE
jgi:hypothetical protein